jgi:hypothetical protein
MDSATQTEFELHLNYTKSRLETQKSEVLSLCDARHACHIKMGTDALS